MAQNKLFIGNLSFRATEDELTEVFSQHGELEEVKIILDRETGRSRGFAFVTFTDEAAAKAALTLDGAAVNGRDIRVSIATERPRRPVGAHIANRF
ncbi:RNA recognition motif domain-containing protein [Sansalvadorimonas verongulae]|uniref:RNA recognition motif domain-containing protein n=1 Tax=Sansalvadorimonas verongulae TaxID=2172824 RepID=UPI0012BCE90C|nr:RNA-binding protein [Sansalvadorimonas verongulae]MTI14742.1 RNA-binding protein [Sansalvadorimonas verongulae]